MEPLAVLRTLKRHWRLILAITVLGGLVGFGTTLLESDEPDTTYYLAVHVLSTESASGNGNQGGGVNLQRSAFLATSGEVPERVAAEVGTSTDELTRAVGVSVRPELGFLEIAAVSDDPNEAINLADVTATELVSYLDEEAQADFEAERLALEAELREIDEAYRAAVAACDARPTSEQALCRSDIETLAARYTAKNEELQAAQAQAERAAAFSTLQTATADPITEAAYKATVAANVAAARGQSTSDANGNSSDQRPVAIQRASATSSEGADPFLRTALGALVGFLLAVGGVIAFDRLDPRLHTKEQTESAFGFPVLAEIPPLTRQQQRERHVLAFEAPRSRAAEAYRTVRSALLFLDSTEPPGTNGNGATAELAKPKPAAGRNGKVILVTSTGPSEGKTTTAANLATVLAETGSSVLVINCDFRRPTLHEYLGGDPIPRKVVESRVPGVRLVQNVVADPRATNPAAVVAEQRKLAEAARKHFDVIVLDTAPVLSTNDALDVLPVADQVLVVARAGRTTSEAADQAAEKLERLGAPVAGVILIGATGVTSSRYYYYYEPDGDQVSPLDVAAPRPVRLEGAAATEP